MTHAATEHEVSEACEFAHYLAHSRERHSFPFDQASIPRNGVYFLFEQGELGHGADRMVRIGTHTGADQLRSRLTQHFLREQKDRSIFRKNIGRCLLSRSQDPYLTVWERDLTTREARRTLPEGFDAVRQAEIEAAVSSYIRRSFTFSVVEVPKMDDRLRLESGLVSLVATCTACRPSAQWLGLASPKEKIRNFGLWQVNELRNMPIVIADIRATFA